MIRLKPYTLPVTGVLMFNTAHALAHPGPHEETTLYEALVHWASNPDHLGMLVAAIAVLAVIKSLWPGERDKS